jgi:hypothetical protein
MADRTNKLRKVATATSQKAQKKEGEGKTSSFGDHVSAELARDMEKWEKERAEREVQEEDEEFNHSDGSAIVESTSDDHDEHNTK